LIITCILLVAVFRTNKPRELPARRARPRHPKNFLPFDLRLAAHVTCTGFDLHLVAPFCSRVFRSPPDSGHTGARALQLPPWPPPASLRCQAASAVRTPLPVSLSPSLCLARGGGAAGGPRRRRAPAPPPLPPPLPLPLPLSVHVVAQWEGPSADPLLPPRLSLSPPMWCRTGGTPRLPASGAAGPPRWPLRPPCHPPSLSLPLSLSIWHMHRGNIKFALHLLFLPSSYPFFLCVV
jgi:hypothetical protein